MKPLLGFVVSGVQSRKLNLLHLLVAWFLLHIQAGQTADLVRMLGAWNWKVCPTPVDYQEMDLLVKELSAHDGTGPA